MHWKRNLLILVIAILVTSAPFVLAFIRSDRKISKISRRELVKALKDTTRFSVIAAFIIFVTGYAVALLQCNCSLSQLSPKGVALIIIGQSWQSLYVFVIPALLVFAEVFFTGWENSSLKKLINWDLSVRKDIFYWFLSYSKISQIVMFVTTLGLFSYTFESIKQTYSLNLQAHLSPLQQLFIGFILNDFVAYWTHRSLHFSPLFWGAHRVHHSATTLHILVAQRSHPLEGVVWKLEQVAIFLLLGASTATFFVFGIIDTVLGQIQHARLRWNYGVIGKVLISPTFHRLHHSIAVEDINKNFGARLVIWDKLFGTYSPKDIPLDAIGINGVSIDETPILEEFIRPYKEFVSRLRRTAPELDDRLAEEGRA